MVGDELHHLRDVHAKHHAPPRGRGGVVQVHDGARCAFDRFDGARNQVFARLGHDHEGHVLGDEVFVDEAAHKVKVGLRCGWKAHLDFLEADAHQLQKSFILRSPFMGSNSAWLPSRRSVESQRGARVMLRLGHWRSAMPRGHGLVFGGGFGDHHGQAPLRWCRAAGARGCVVAAAPARVIRNKSDDVPAAPCAWHKSWCGAGVRGCRWFNGCARWQPGVRTRADPGQALVGLAVVGTGAGCVA